MTDFYSRMAATSLRMLTKYGLSITLRQYSAGGGDYDPNTGKATPLGQGSYDTTRMGLVVDFPGNRIGPQYGQTLQNGTLIQETDRWIYIDANGISPKLQDHIIISGTEFSVIDVQTISPAGAPVLYLLVLRA